MYQFSRAIYRELAPYITEQRADATGATNHKHVLDAVSYTHLTLPTILRV